MRRVNAILRHPAFAERLNRLEVLEEERRFCRHDLTHLLDVARLMWIEVLESGAQFDRELVYAAALLHDIGRADQMERGVPHEEAGARLAARILPEAGFAPEEVSEVLEAIRSHRGGSGERRDLAALLYRADKASRSCWRCAARGDCNWPEDRKNAGIAR